MTFATLHIPGSNNNLGRGPRADGEHRARMRVTLRWLAGAFEAARRRDSVGMVIALQANPRFERGRGRRRGYEAFVAALGRQLRDYTRPVLLVHGDTHTYRVDNPLPEAPNLTRVETFGSPSIHWVRIHVDPASPQVFSVTPELVEANPPSSQDSPRSRR